MSEAGPSSNPHQRDNLPDSHGSRKPVGRLSAAVAGARVGRSGIAIKEAGEEAKRRDAPSNGHKTSGGSHLEGKKSRDSSTRRLKYVATIAEPANEGGAHEKALRGSSKLHNHHHHRHQRFHNQRRAGFRRHHKRHSHSKANHPKARAQLISSTPSHVSTHKHSVAHMQLKSTSSLSSLASPPDGPIKRAFARPLTESSPAQALAQTSSTASNKLAGPAASSFNYLLLLGLPLYACLMFAIILCLLLRYCKNAQRAFKAKSCSESKKNPNKIKRFIAAPIGFISNGKLFNQKSSAESSVSSEPVKSKPVSETSVIDAKGDQRKSLDCRQLTINMEGSELSTEDSDCQQSATSNETQAKVSRAKGKAAIHLGRLKYSLEYDFDRNLLTVCIHEAYELAAMDQNGYSDPYVNIYMANNKNYPTFRTKIHKRTLNPAFNETFTFQISYTELIKQTLIMSVYDYDKLTRHDEIGQLTLPMNSIDLAQRQVNCSELRKMNEANEGRLGDICLSLRYVPTAGRLNVVVLEARQLKKMDVAGLSDPYVKLALISQGKRLKKKKTSIKKCTLNPHFNESFSFEVPFDQAQKVQLVVTVVDYDRIGTSEPIGSITMGYEQATSETEQRHWMDMLASPRRPIARWHTLRGIDFDPKRPVLSRRLSQLINNN